VPSPPYSGRSAKELVHRTRTALQEAIGRIHLHRAWDLLQERNEHGDPKGARPYTDQAIIEFQMAYARDPEDPGVIHHLAIAHHARAWDLESANDQLAAAEWERALGYWRILGASGEFWAVLETKFHECDPEANASPIADLRRGLLENLLDIHVDFVRRYSESETPGRASIHLDIVRRALIPPAVKSRLIGKVFEAMTGSVPEAKANRNYASALTLVDRFLGLFPDYLPALRLHAEISNEWISTLSYKDDWPKIVAIEQSARAHASRTAAHPSLGEYLLASTALEELALTIACRGNDRGTAEFQRGDRDEARESLDIGIWWGHLACPQCPEDAPLRNVLAACLYGRVACLHEEVQALGMDETVDAKTKFAVAKKFYGQIIAGLEQAIEARPANQDLLRHLDQELEASRNLLMQLQTARQLGGFN